MIASISACSVLLFNRTTLLTPTESSAPVECSKIAAPKGPAGAAHHVLPRQIDRHTHPILVGRVARPERHDLVDPLRPRDEY
jgi:hypothetical protein